MTTYRFQPPFFEPEDPITIRDLLYRINPDLSDSQIAEILASKRLLEEGNPLSDPERPAHLDAEYHLLDAYNLPSLTFDPLNPTILQRGEGWVVIHKPVGCPGRLTPTASYLGADQDPLHPLNFIADVIGFDRSQMTPLWPMPFLAEGAWVLCENTKIKEKLINYFKSGALCAVFTAIVPRERTFVNNQGVIFTWGRISEGLYLNFAATRMGEGISEVQLTPDFATFFKEGFSFPTPEFDPFAYILDMLSSHRTPIIMDLNAEDRYATINTIYKTVPPTLLAGGPLRFQLTSLYPSADPLPDAPIGTWSTTHRELQMPDLDELKNIKLKKGSKSLKKLLSKRLRFASKEVGLWVWWPCYPLIQPSRVKVEEEESSEKSSDGSLKLKMCDFVVSNKTLEVMRKTGHPWVLADAKTGSRKGLAVGQLVRLVGKGGAGSHGHSLSRTSIYALIDSLGGELVARAWCGLNDPLQEGGASAGGVGKGRGAGVVVGEGVQNDSDPLDIEQEARLRFDEAVARREAILADNTTSIYRLVNGEADGLPGLYVDRCGSLYRATIYGGAAFAFKDLIYDELELSEPGVMILEVDHRNDVRCMDTLPYAVVARGPKYVGEKKRITATEDGLSYYISPWHGIDVGFFADQRSNRRRLDTYLSRHKHPGRWLNLFCHTGAFTVRLCAQGAHCVNVDLSKKYLKTLKENMTLNKLDLKLITNVVADARTYVARQVKGLEEARRSGLSDVGYDGIIVDPPTAASGDGEFWSVRSDYANLLRQCFDLLRRDVDTVMLVCRNDRQSSGLKSTLIDLFGTNGINYVDGEVSSDCQGLSVLGDSFESVFMEVKGGRHDK